MENTASLFTDSDFIAPGFYDERERSAYSAGVRARLDGRPIDDAQIESKARSYAWRFGWLEANAALHLQYARGLSKCRPLRSNLSVETPIGLDDEQTAAHERGQEWRALGNSVPLFRDVKGTQAEKVAFRSGWEAMDRRIVLASRAAQRARRFGFVSFYEGMERDACRGAYELEGFDFARTLYTQGIKWPGDPEGMARTYFPRPI